MARYLCLGGAVIDRKLKALRPFHLGTSNPARGSVNFGGVARNVAENLARLGATVGLVSCVGDDASGRALVAHLADLGIDTAQVRVVIDASTAEYIALIEPDGALRVAAADMGVLDQIYGSLVTEALATSTAADWMFVDCNAPAPVLANIVEHARQTGLRLAIDVISTPKAERLPQDLSGVGCLFLNRDEAAAILRATPDDPAAMALALAGRGAARVVLTLGADGAVLCEHGDIHHIAAEAATVSDVTGAGDAMVAGTLLGLGAGLDLVAAARLGAKVASRTVASALSVAPDLSPVWALQAMAEIASSGGSVAGKLK